MKVINHKSIENTLHRGNFYAVTLRRCLTLTDSQRELSCHFSRVPPRSQTIDQVNVKQMSAVAIMVEM